MNDVTLDPEADVSDRGVLRLSEVFDSLQGEGVNMGKPCRFVRLAICNLHCHYCDTKYTWDFKHFDYDNEVHEATLQAVAEQLRTAPAGHVVITGGEPLLQQRALAQVFERVPPELFIEIETNGTRAPLPSLRERVNQWNVSPKLLSAGDPESLRIRPDALTALRDTGRAYLKVVVKTSQDRDEAEALRVRFGFDKDRTLLMPEATTPEELERRSPEVAGWSQQLSVRFSSRLHVALWGGRRAT
ncbi:MAG TPA: 7-carboxy-7-deazaguanine synthase QueE [Polyangiaceae bacterium]|nr:7-carboxy-7-deazaguanine synthase QueE [Polyangiaceae bacterium]